MTDQIRCTHCGGDVSAAERCCPKCGTSRPAPQLVTNSEPNFKKGDFIGHKYEVLNTLGEGGFGVVYLVYSHEVESLLALKTFRDMYLADAQVRLRFEREARIWVRLKRHPYIVRAYFVERIGGRPYVAMAYIAPNPEGINSLQEHIHQGSPNLVQSLRWAIQCCYGMEYAHLRGIGAHRDLKPANIMVGCDNTAKINDFGLAGVIKEEWCVGTPEYMSPEQFTNASSCDERSDIYSFGVVLHHMVTGSPPFVGPWTHLSHLHRYAPVPAIESLAESPLSLVILRCIEKEPEKRYQSFRELRADLEEHLKQERGEVISPPELPKLGAWGWNLEGSSLNSLGFYTEALECFEEALRIVPRFVGVLVNKGRSLGNLNRYEEAIECYDKVLQIDPRSVNALIGKGTALDSLGQHEEATGTLLESMCRYG